MRRQYWGLTDRSRWQIMNFAASRRQQPGGSMNVTAGIAQSPSARAARSASQGPPTPPTISAAPTSRTDPVCAPPGSSRRAGLTASTSRIAVAGARTPTRSVESGDSWWTCLTGRSATTTAPHREPSRSRSTHDGKRAPCSRQNPRRGVHSHWRPVGHIPSFSR
jgi:hypothetical protein